mgnify:CR=1 FL=1
MRNFFEIHFSVVFCDFNKLWTLLSDKTVRVFFCCRRRLFAYLREILGFLSKQLGNELEKWNFNLSRDEIIIIHCRNLQQGVAKW